MKLACHKLAYITFPTKDLLNFYIPNFATVHSRVSAGGCSVEYVHKLLRQFTTTEPEELTAGPHEALLLISRNRTERQWLKHYWILAKWVPSNFANKLWQTENVAMLHK